MADRPGKTFLYERHQFGVFDVGAQSDDLHLHYVSANALDLCQHFEDNFKLDNLYVQIADRVQFWTSTINNPPSIRGIQ